MQLLYMMSFSLLVILVAGAVAAAKDTSGSSSSSISTSSNTPLSGQPRRVGMVLSDCNSSDVKQAWELRADWGDNNTLINARLYYSSSSSNHHVSASSSSTSPTTTIMSTTTISCLDIAEWDTANGARVGPYKCCCSPAQNASLCTDCGQGRWYNQVFLYNNDNGLITSSVEMKHKCLTVVSNNNNNNNLADAATTTTTTTTTATGTTATTAAAGDKVVMDACQPSELTKQAFNYVPGAISLRANPKLCLSAAAVPTPPPTPSPPPPPGPKPSPPPAPGPQPVEPCASGHPGADMPWCDVSLSASARAKDLVSRLTLDEKIAQLSTNSFSNNAGGTTPAVLRLGVPAYNYHSEGLHGIRDSQAAQLNATLYPQVTAMAATGNMSLVYEMGQVMGLELRALSNVAKRTGKLVRKGLYLSIYGPTINIIRDPRWGRSQESVSEDPWLNGAYAVSFMRGIQGDPSRAKGYLQVAATCKHLAAYSLEGSDGFSRHDFNAVVSARDMADTYLPAFKACVIDGQPQQIMCSYNSINGVPACLHGDIQNGLMRQKWGFNGSVVSDCDAIGDAYRPHKYSPTPAAAAAQGIRGGCDQDCGATYGLYGAAAVAGGLLNTSDIDTALERILLIRFRTGEFDAASAVPYRNIPPSVLENAAARDSALRAARESMVLLQNNVSLLPLLGNPAGHSLAVVGAIADSTKILMGGKSDYSPSDPVSVLAGLKAAGADVAYAPGYKSVTSMDKSGFAAAVAAAKSRLATLVVVGMDASVEHEGGDRTTLALTGVQEELVQELLKAVGPNRLIVAFVNGGPVSSTWIRDNVPTVLEVWYNGQATGTALADVLWGTISPSGVLPFTVYPESYVNSVKMSDMNMRPNVTSGNPGRTYRFYTGTPLYPFGHGLSYTTFSMKWANKGSQAPLAVANTMQAVPPISTLLSSQMQEGAEEEEENKKRRGENTLLTYTVSVTNTGKMAGSKVVQLFLAPSDEDKKAWTRAAAPQKWLFGQQKVHLKPGASAQLSFSAAADYNGLLSTACAFCVADEHGVMSVRPGKYSISVGTHAELTHTVTLHGSVQVLQSDTLW